MLDKMCKLVVTGVAAALLTPVAVYAHRAWLLPSATVLSSSDPWVTVDAARSNDLFYFDHVPIGLDGMTVLAPDGSTAPTEHPHTGKYRSTFDVHLTQEGTYKIYQASDFVLASYRDGGEIKRWRGTAAAFAKEVPANAPELSVSRSHNRMEVFVTRGKPTATALQATGVGLELVPVTHPNDLVTGEAAQFALTLNGKPAAGVAVSFIPGGIRYRDQLNEMKLTTDSAGKVSVTFPEPGMYWMNAVIREGNPEPAMMRRPGGPGGPQGKGARPPAGVPVPAASGPVRPGVSASYVATLEVMAQ